MRYMALKYVCFDFFKTLCYTHIQIYTTAAGTKCYTNNVCDTFPEHRFVNDYEKCKIGKSAIMLGSTATSSITHDF